MTLDEAIQEFEFDCKIRHRSRKTIDNYHPIHVLASRANEGKLFDLDDALVYTDADDNIVHTIQVDDNLSDIAQVIIEKARDSAIRGDSFDKTRRILEGNYGEGCASFFSDGNGRYGRGEIAGGSGKDQGRNGQARGKGVSVQAR